MKQEVKRVSLVIVTVLCGAFLAGCESLSDGWQAELQSDVAVPAVSRARVVAELREAQRLGMITTGEEDVPQYTFTQIEMISKAGEEAVGIAAVAK